MRSLLLLSASAVLLQAITITPCHGFSASSSSLLLSSPLHSSKVLKLQKSIIVSPLYSTENDDADSSSTSTTANLSSLEEKMKSWEASEDEIRAATLGGVIPGSGNNKQAAEDGAERTDAFDIGLYIAFPIMVIGCLIFAFFPLIVSNIDVTSVGPPPTS